MLAGSINYSLSLGFALTFLLGSMVLVSILHTYRNLAQLTIYAGKAASVFAVQPASFAIHLANRSAVERLGKVIDVPRALPPRSEPALTVAAA